MPIFSDEWNNTKTIVLINWLQFLVKNFKMGCFLLKMSQMGGLGVAYFPQIQAVL
jgi:hypothetical protein